MKLNFQLFHFSKFIFNFVHFYTAVFKLHIIILCLFFKVILFLGNGDESCYVVQANLELLDSSSPPASTSHVTRTTGPHHCALAL